MNAEDSERIEAIRRTYEDYEPKFAGDTLEPIRWLLDLVERQEAALNEAQLEFRVFLEETAEDMRPYVSDFFAAKWGHDEGLERARNYLARVGNGVA